MNSKETPEINAGSMADIAFLLLIFFLITTTLQTDTGILRKIAEKPKENYIVDLKEKNIFTVAINFNNELWVENEPLDFNELKAKAINFIDNGGGLDKDNLACSWCKGAKDPASSDHPTKAVIVLQADRNTNYETYIKVLDILNGAYTQLRNQLSVTLYQENYVSLVERYELSNSTDTTIKEKIDNIKRKYPLLISDAEITN